MTLPFVFSFLLLLALGAYSLTSEMLSVNCLSHALAGSRRADAGLHERATKRAFRKLNKKKAEKKEPTKQSSISREVHSIRRESSKLNVKQLVVASRLIHILYRETAIEPEIERLFGKKYGEALLEAFSKKEKDLPEEPEKRALLYKLMRGTVHYTLEGKKREGIPPLVDFLTVRGSGSQINFPRASPPLLIALFGPECTAAILQAELNKGSLKKGELEALLTNFPEAQKSYAALSKQITFHSETKGKKELIFLDKKTKIERRKPL